MNLLKWLQSASEFPKFYMRSKEGDVERAAIGRGDSKEMQIGGMAFFPELPLKDALWSDFPKVAFWTPKREKKQQVVVDPAEPFTTRFANEHSIPTEENWQALILHSLGEIERGALNKVVIARRTTLDIQVDPFALLEQLKSRSVGASLFAIQFSPESAFIGATPERLYRRKGRHIWVDALAGTRLLGVEGLESDLKEQREFAFVKRSIEEAIGTFCKEWRWQGDDRIHKTSRVQHLYNCFVGELQEGIEDADLIRALHPTAALGGTPRKSALEFIAANEPFERGWYAAPLGFATRDEAEFIVGIRSALVTRDQIHLFAGTGIVSGSQPAREWQELNDKISLIKGVFA